MSGWLEGMGPGVGNHLWQTTAFAALAWVVTLLLRRNQARVRYAVWMAASVKFLVPFSLLIGFGALLPRPQRAVVAMPVYSAVDEVGMPFSEIAPEAHPTDAAMRPRHGWGTRLVRALPAGLAVVWLCGVGLVLVVWCVRWRQVVRTLRRGRRAEDGREIEILRRVEERMGRRGHPVPLLLSRELMEPGMFGIWRPVLIWPERLSERLEDEHIEAVMIHEIAHARRRDNLTAALHMLVEAAFWFHPAVWWMERRMVEERERACDEAVVAMGSRPGVYAESLLQACRFCVESPLVCVAGITGADLNRRVRGIMTLRLERLGWGRKIVLAAFVSAALIGPVGFGILRMMPMYGQMLHARGPRPSFAVASIRPSRPDDPEGGSVQADSYVGKAKTIREIIEYAYGIGYERELSGGPKWISTDKYTILARPDDAELAALGKMPRDDRDEQMRLMVQSLLANRFGLKVSFLRKVLPVYALVVGKGGLKCANDEASQPAIPDMSQPRFRWSEGPAPPPPPPGWTPPTPEEARRRAETVPLHMRTQGWPFWLVVTFLSHQPELDGRTVIDETGLNGIYDCQMSWSQEGSNGPGPSLFSALQAQMGLKLKPEKRDVETLVINSIERPSEN